MEPKPSITLAVHGVFVTIDYVNGRVGWPKGLDRDVLARISAYVCDEGFLDEDFIALCKEQK